MIARRALALAIILFAAAPLMAATPHPQQRKAAPHAIPTPVLPNQKLQTEFVVEVNSKGQVVRVKSGKDCKNYTFNAQTYGNVLQMWIRHPNGTAEVGLYRVTYDYNPKTKKVRRSIALIRAGGNWGNQQGAANEMMAKAAKESREAQEAQEKKLPPLSKILAPSHTPKP
jgi:hypothetical protein